MVPDVSPSRDTVGPRPARVVWRLRTLAVCVGLTAIAFVQDAGLTSVDTKVDLAVNPVGWLARALHLWNPAGDFGQVQNQAYGYLWPMGPFFAGGEAMGLPIWVVQRLWWALLFCVAFLGLVKLAERLAIGTPAARLVAGVAFALSPRILTEIGSISVEAWPTAVAPWVLVPLVGLAQGAPLRRAVTLSALAVACAGGVNATAVLAVVPLAGLWLLGLEPTRRRLTALVAWGAAVALATAWWVVPLFILGRYSPPFLDYIETASTTTRVTDPVSVLRGSSHWLAYLYGPHGPQLPAGFRLVFEYWLIVAALAIVVLGLIGLARRGMPHRRFLVTALIVGLALVGFGHVSSLDLGLAQAQREFLDGVGAPLRNVHKFDVVLRIPLLLGLAHLLGGLGRVAAVAGRGWHWPRVRALAASGVALAAVLGVANPALDAGLAGPGSFVGVPPYWQQAATWLDDHVGDDHVLVLPGARFPAYWWGSPSDEVIQALMRQPWAVRSANPLTPPGTIRLLDAIDTALATGAGSPGLADVLARSGVRYVLLRSDLEYGRSGTPRPIVVKQALARSPGLYRVAGFGPELGADKPDGFYLDAGLHIPVQALEVYAVNRPVAPVDLADAADVTTIAGGPEALLSLASSGELPAAPAVLAGDALPGRPVGRAVVTDSLRRRDVAFGLPGDNASATLGLDQSSDLPGPAHDYLPGWGEAWQSSVTYAGIRAVTASSAWSQVQPLVGSRPEHQPFAAIDGDPATSWRTAPGVAPIGQWLEIAFDRPTTVTEVRLSFDFGADTVPTRVAVTAGIEQGVAETFGLNTVVQLPGNHAVQRLVVSIQEVKGLRVGTGGVGIAEVQLAGLRAERILVVPPAPAAAGPATMLFSAAPTTPSCVFYQDNPRCAAKLARGSEDGVVIDRQTSVASDASYTPTVWAQARPGTALDALLDQRVAAATALALAPTVHASSTYVPDPAGRPGSVVDGNDATAWSPQAEDRNPWLRLNWLVPRTLTGLKLTLDPDVAATRPAVVTAVGDDGVQGGLLGADGIVRFAQPLHTDEVTILLLDRAPAASFDPYINNWEYLPFAIGEVVALDDPPNAQPDLTAPWNLPCGSGPTLTVNGAQVRTALRATLRDLIELREVPAVPCGSVAAPVLAVPSGPVHVVAGPSDVAVATRVLLTPRTGAVRPAARPAAVTTLAWGATQRQVRVPASPVERMLVVHENTNAGWRATAGDRVLQPIVVDGWQQGWLVPAGVSGEIVLRYAPDGPYRMALLYGAVALAVLLMVALIPQRPQRRRGAHAVAGRGGSGRLRGEVLLPAVAGIALLSAGGLVSLGLALLGILAAALGRVVRPRLIAPDQWRRRRAVRTAEWLLPAILFAVAGWVSLNDDARWSAPVPYVVALAAATALWLSLVVRARRTGTRAAQR